MNNKIAKLIGCSLIGLLDLKVKSNGRVDTSTGDKTPQGLYLTIQRYIDETIKENTGDMEYYKVSINECNGDFEYDIDFLVKCKPGTYEKTMRKVWLDWRGSDESDIDENGDLWCDFTVINYPCTTQISYSDFTVLSKYLSVV
jgi:hypothetical protein